MTKNKHLADSTNPDRAPRFLCPGCGEEVEVLREHFGRRIECPSCRRRFKADVRKEMKLRELQERAKQIRQQRESEKQKVQARLLERAAHGALPGDPAEPQGQSRPEVAGDTPRWPAFYDVVLYLVASLFFVSGLVNLSESAAVAALLCIVVGLLICLLVSLAEIRHALRRRR